MHLLAMSGVKLRRDTQHYLEDVQDGATHLKYIQFILLEFDTNNALGEG